jgi:orotidine-5'-phosphate decarboxylase
MPPAPPDDRLIVALDRPDRARAETLVAALGPAAAFVKIGLGMLAGDGLGLARALKAEGRRVFLDLKLFDIGATVEAAVNGLAGLGMDFLTVHGDPPVVRAAVAGRGATPTRVLAVTVLTSLDRGDLDAMLMAQGTVSELAVERARRALAAGADGVIAAPHEAAAIRALPEAAGRLIVTPGIRPEGSAAGDQKRIATPRAALEAGADHIVVGRPIWAAHDPRAAAEAILAGLPPR